MALRKPTSSNQKLNSTLRYRRIVVKAGTNVLTRKSANLDPEAMRALVAEIADVSKQGAQVILVTSGAIAAGREAAPSVADGKGVAVSQMLAAIGQGRLMHAYQELFSNHRITVAQALITRKDVEDRIGYLNVRNTLEGLISKDIVPIVNENDVVDTAEINELRFGDNDTLSALVANIVDADLLLMLTDTGGLFTADPNRDPSSHLIPRVDVIDASVMALAEEHRDRATRGGMSSKLVAAKRATDAGVTVVFSPGVEAGVVMRAAHGDPVGTLFPTAVSPLESRKRWLVSGMAESGGMLIIDDGARRALAEQDRSLLPAGVREVRGEFSRGDVVEISEGTADRVAYGIANYGAADMRKIVGTRSDRIMTTLGHHFGDEAVHRNNMVVL